MLSSPAVHSPMKNSPTEPPNACTMGHTGREAMSYCPPPLVIAKYPCKFLWKTEKILLMQCMHVDSRQKVKNSKPLHLYNYPKQTYFFIARVSLRARHSVLWT